MARRTRPGLRRAALACAALLFAKSAFAFFEPITWSLVAEAAVSIGAPVCYLLGCATAYSPAVRVFGDKEAVYGLDWGSLACHAGSVYGLQLSFCGGSFEERLCGLQLGLLASGYAQLDLPFDGYHFCNLETCRMNGLQFGTFAAKTATANGLQLSAVYAGAKTVNGLQVGLLTMVGRLRGLQVGLVNVAGGGAGLQVGLANCAGSGLAGCLPVLNLVY